MVLILADLVVKHLVMDQVVGTHVTDALVVKEMLTGVPIVLGCAKDVTTNVMGVRHRVAKRLLVRPQDEQNHYKNELTYK